MSRLVDRTKVVKWLRANAMVMRMDIEDWPEDFEMDGCAEMLDWAAELILKYAPNEVPSKSSLTSKQGLV